MVVRDAAPTDAEAIGHLHALSWRATYRGILSDDYLDHWAEKDRLDAWRGRFVEDDETRRLRVATEGDRLAGFACVMLDCDERWGALLDNLHVHPDMKSRGLGRLLMHDAVTWVLQQRPKTWLHLWVYEANHGARGFYERFGGVAVEWILQHAIDGHDVPSMRYAWGDLKKLASALGAHAAE